jgi:hypothetical protein
MALHIANEVIMRIVFGVGLAAALILSTVVITGCGDNRGKAEIPATTLEVPKNGPTPAGAPGGADKGKPKSSEQ